MPQFPPEEQAIAHFRFQGSEENICVVLDPPAQPQEHCGLGVSTGPCAPSTKTSKGDAQPPHCHKPPGRAQAPVQELWVCPAPRGSHAACPGVTFLTVAASTMSRNAL